MSHCAGKVKSVPTDDDLVRTARGLGIAFGDELLDPVTEEALAALQ